MRQTNFRFLNLLWCAAIVIGFTVVANAQFKAALQGTVSDVNGASIAGATVVLNNVETNKEVQTISSDSGFYRFNGLAPGNYTLTVTQTNFKQNVTESITIDADKLQGLDVRLEAGGVSETVTVTSEREPLKNGRCEC